jgi:hypothetical protein
MITFDLHNPYMKKQTFSRKYNVPDADLYLLCMEKIKCAHTDLQQFVSYGYNAERMKTYLIQCEKFKALPDDDEMIGEQMVLTEKKDSAAENLKAAIRSIMTRVEVKYTNRSGRFRKFGTAKMGDMSDAQLLFCGRRVLRVARAQADFLSDVGINENSLFRLQEAGQVFENALHIQQDKVADRDIAVENRSEAGNKLYDELVVLCNIGKDIWDNKDVTKYENYVLYESNNEQKKAKKAQDAMDAIIPTESEKE